MFRLCNIYSCVFYRVDCVKPQASQRAFLAICTQVQIQNVFPLPSWRFDSTYTVTTPSTFIALAEFTAAHDMVPKAIKTVVFGP